MSKPAAVVAIGIFDGVHLGHQAILRTTLRRASALGALPVALTFSIHPSRILAPGHPVPLVQTFSQRCDSIRSLGIRRIYPLHFTKSLARLSPAQFVERVLFRHWNVKGVVVGRGFRFGHRRAGTVRDLDRLLRDRGAFALAVKPVLSGGTAIQSTRVRRMVSAGRVESAAKLLGRPLELVGRVETGAGLGGKTGARTVNIHVANELQPKFGVYAGWLKTAGGQGCPVPEAPDSGNPRTGFPSICEGGRCRPAVMNFGVAPTLRASRRAILEVHVLDGKRVSIRPAAVVAVDVVRFLRPERKFSNLARLKAAIQTDVARAKRILKWKRK
ncbi:hypothetical protein HY522_07450 [bacterium]|nr:hypothetical protein [bacterium]